MFPLTSNEAYIKSTGERSTLGRMLEDGGNEQLEAKLDDEIEARAELGAHNRLPMSLAEIKSLNTDGTWNENVYSWRGIDYTIYADSNGNITGIKADGTANARGWLFISTYNFNMPGSVDYAENTTYNGYHFVNDNYTFNKITVIYNHQSYRTYIAIDVDQTIDDRMFYPLVTISSDTNNTYQPYAMTNQELTADKLSVSTLKSIVADSADFAAFKTAIAAL